MATLSRTLILVAALAGCDTLAGFDGETTPLATIQLEVTGDFGAVARDGADAARLSAALVWGDQWLPEPICFLPPGSAEVAGALVAGCRDPFGFIPQRVAENVAVELDAPAAITLDAVPSADVMVGDVTSRIAYAALVVYDDVDGSGALELGRFSRWSGDDDDDDPGDVVYGSSFVSMTEPDVRVVLREGAYNPRAAFYPRVGCGEPPPGFSLAAAGGFSAGEAILATLNGELPEQNPASCQEMGLEDRVVEIRLRAPEEVAEVGCRGRRADSSVRYREPPLDPIDLTDRVAACAPLPMFGNGAGEDIVQLLVSTRSTDRCKGLSHYVLRGCREDAACAFPEWDVTATPPDWWPCPVGP